METGNILKKYSSCFDGVGLLKIEPVKISVKEDAEPVVQAPRKLPYAILNELKTEFDKVEKMNITIE